MKTLNMQEMDQVTGGASFGQYINKIGEIIDTGKEIINGITGNDTDIVVTKNEDGTVTASGGW